MVCALCCAACAGTPGAVKPCSPATIWLLEFRNEIAQVSVAERTIWQGGLTVDDEDTAGISQMIETCLGPTERVIIEIGRRHFAIEMPSAPGPFYVTVYPDGVYNVRTVPPILD